MLIDTVSQAAFIDFNKEEVEGSIAARFDLMAGRFAKRAAVTTGRSQLTYETLNRAAATGDCTVPATWDAGNCPVAWRF
jgi:hypothetical protein